MDPNVVLTDMLTRLASKYPTKALIAEALQVKYVTVAHWYAGLSYPSFETTLRILNVLGIDYGA